MFLAQPENPFKGGCTCLMTMLQALTFLTHRFRGNPSPLIRQPDAAQLPDYFPVLTSAISWLSFCA